jgi:3-hydroxyisobutyrate dehydrogenase-like beta-hydroxyacid dehydrogenase
MAKPTAGFIGLGAMGYQMARHMMLGLDVYGIDVVCTENLIRQ